tara:strand:+ start:3276 stop:3773 length:498 start_codon:yes stop_codon:yes gene_type:complete
MAILDILEFPDPRLRTVAKPVQKVDDKIQHLIDNMLETMYEAQGIGLAATQVNMHRQVIVIDLSEQKDAPLVLINPSFEVLDDGAFDYQEGCLSVPGVFEEVSRPAHIKVKALGRDGKLFELVPDGLLAVCIQHEIDHLNGKLFVDHLSALKRNRIKQKIKKDRR